MLFPNFFLSLLTAKQSNPLISPLIFTCSIKLNLCVNLQCIICHRNSHTYNLSKYKSISVLVEERGYLTRKRPWSGYCLSHKAGMGSVAFFFFFFTSLIRQQLWKTYEKPRSHGIMKTTGFRHSVWGGKEHARKEKTQARDNIQTLSNLYEKTQHNIWQQTVLKTIFIQLKISQFFQ